MPQALKPYKYQPLPDDQSIRLARRSLDNDTDTWSCQFQVAHLQNPPEYVALSYCWGDVTQRVPITCDDGTIMVTQSAAKMLEAICRGPVPFWVDSVCINQQDFLERNQQVALMADVYGKAALVIVWLGPDPNRDADILLGSFKDLVERIALLHAMGGKITFLERDSVNLHWTAPNGQAMVSPLPSSLVLPDESERKRLARFFTLPWFSRTWVLQEVGLAAQTNVIWGGLAMDWNAIGFTALFLVRYAKPLLDRLDLASAVQNVRQIYTTFSPFTPRDTFLQLLNNTRELKATDPRDKIYAFLSHPTACTISMSGTLPPNTDAYKDYMDLIIQLLPHMQDQYLVKQLVARKKPTAAIEAKQLEPLIKADYRKPVSEVYRDVALEHIKRTISLDMLSAVQHDCKADSQLPCPSWVPQWNMCNGTQALGFATSNHFASANRDAVVTPSVQCDLNTLIVRGHIVSKVTYASSLCRPSSFDWQSLPDGELYTSSNAVKDTWLRTKLYDLAAQGTKYARTVLMMTTNGLAILGPESDISTAYLRTWVAGKGRSEVDAFDFENDANAYWDRIWTTSSEGASAPSEDTLMRAERFRASAAAVASQRKFFGLKKGLFGLGPGAMRTGDWVAVLLGADVPFVLREVGGEQREAGDPFPDDVKFQLVGECYVDGLMTGGAVKGVYVKRDIVLV
ncbi:MAG: hypothetical protein L6R40_006041 [Gallowayella cf. fulva]|nr:MAG: hypothetical protein L6R40_006041 [Xanthomendoza cf. fulva]